jgi:Zinc carboxypeptidase
MTSEFLAIARAAGLGLALLLLAGGLSSSGQWTPADLARVWDAEHVSSSLTPLVDHAEVMRRLETIRRDPSGLFRVRDLGRSIEGRTISEVTFGSGPYVVLLWSQMHGDEGTATSALFDLYAWVGRHRDDASVQQILGALTVHTVPMLNPDGGDRWQRRNAQQIDVNRDALLLQSPEGRILEALRDEIRPRVGFNLHNQNWNTTAGRPPVPAAISLLSVAFDEGRTMSAGRLLTKQLAAVVREAIEPMAPGRIGRYDDSFEVRAFGDNFTKQGTPVLLIETGPWPDEHPDAPLVRLNFVAIVHALAALADGSVAGADPGRYDSLPENESLGFYLIIRHATVVVSPEVPPFEGDIGIATVRRVRAIDGVRRVFLNSTVGDVGDLRTHAGVFEIDGTGRVVAPLVSGAPVGTVLPANALTGSLQVGGPADLMLLSREGAGYRVDRIFMAQDEIR